MRVAEMNEMTKHQVQYGQQKVELLSKKDRIASKVCHKSSKGG